MYDESREAVPPRDFRICPNCGQPTPSQLPDCVHCGARSLQSVVYTDQARAEERFARAFFSRPAPLTYVILIFNLIVYGLMAVAAGGEVAARLIYGVDPVTLVAFGAKTNRLLADQHQWFRLVTPIFIHIGLLHLASNSYALWIVGPQVERLYGSARFMLIYLLTGIGGVAGSYLGHYLRAQDPNTPSAGASGAIFGLFGVLVVFGYKYRHELPPAFRRAFGAGIFPVIAINLFIGFTVPFIDNSAHIGGLVTGAVLALIVPYLAPGRERASVLGPAILAVCVGAVAYSFVRAYQQNPAYFAQLKRVALGQSPTPAQPRTASPAGRTNASPLPTASPPNRRPAPNALAGVTPIARNYIEKVSNANLAMVSAINSYQPDAKPEARQQALAQITKAADELEATAAPDERAEGIRRDLAQALRKQQAALSNPSPLTQVADLQASISAFNQVSLRFKEWLETEGLKYGLRVQSNNQ